MNGKLSSITKGMRLKGIEKYPNCSADGCERFKIR
jgi:hypothetical protein